MNELVDLKRALTKIHKWWASSLGTIIALVIGIAIGILYVENRIINDCKFVNGFRVDSQSFNCQRKI